MCLFPLCITNYLTSYSSKTTTYSCFPKSHNEIVLPNIGIKQYLAGPISLASICCQRTYPCIFMEFFLEVSSLFSQLGNLMIAEFD